MPGFVDFHARLVFGPPVWTIRDRAGGKSYAEIAAAGGGIA